MITPQHVLAGDAESSPNLNRFNGERRPKTLFIVGFPFERAEEFFEYLVVFRCIYV